jgi:hypothetical protein
VEEKVAVWKVMTEKERDEVRDMFREAIDNHYEKLDGDQAEAFKQKVDAANSKINK